MNAAYFLRRALRGMRESAFGALVATGTIALALFALGAVGAAGLVTARALSAWGGELRLTVYLDEGAAPEARDAVARRLSGLGPGPVTAVGKAQALAALRASLGDVGPILDDLPDNPLRDSLERPIPTLDPSALAALSRALRAMPGVADVDDGAEWLAPAERLLRWLRRAGGALLGLVVLSTLILVANTFRLAVYARRDEIGILKLVGATDAFVRIPFLLEGFIEGALGGGLAALGLGAGFVWLWPRVAEAVPLLASLGPTPLSLGRWLLGVVGLGGLLGLCSSGLSVGRFLEV
ncbi:MAG: cell division protein FtsX [Deltaproteobacteria bacterium]